MNRDAITPEHIGPTEDATALEIMHAGDRGLGEQR